MSQVFEQWQREFSKEQVSELNNDLVRTRADRLRAAMCPETLDDGASYVGTQYEEGELTCVQRLSEPSQLLKEAIIMIIHYQDDVDVTAVAIPELIRLLQDDDPNVARQAAGTLYQLARKEAPRHAIIANQHLIPAIVKVLTTNDDPETVKSLAGTLQAISGSPKGLMSIFKSGGIPALIKMLSSPIDKVVHYSLTTLHNILQHQGEEAKRAVILAGGVQKMVDLLSKENAQLRFLALLTDCLEILAFQNPSSKAIIVSKNGTAQLVRLLQIHRNYEKLLFTTCRLLKVLSVDNTNKQAIIEEGGMNVLGNLLEHQSPRLVMNALWTLRNLSDQATKAEGLDDLLRKCVQMLESNEIGIVMCCVGILSNLTCNNAHNKFVVFNYGGVEGLVQIILQAVERDDITEPAICALRHLTSRHEHAHTAQEDVRHAIPTLVKLLGPASHFPLIKAAIGLCRNLGLSNQNQQILREAGAIPKLVQLLWQAQSKMQHGGNDDQEEIVPVDIAEGCIGALHVLARDPINRTAIKESNVISTICSFLSLQSVNPSLTNENMQRSAAGLLCELAADKDAVEIIEKQNVTHELQALLHSPNESVATYAAATMYRMSEDKSPDVRKRLSQELTHSLFRADEDVMNYDVDEAIFRVTRPVFGMNDVKRQIIQKDEKEFAKAMAQYEKDLADYDAEQASIARKHAELDAQIAEAKAKEQEAKRKKAEKAAAAAAATSGGENHEVIDLGRDNSAFDSAKGSPALAPAVNNSSRPESHHTVSRAPTRISTRSTKSKASQLVTVSEQVSNQIAETSLSSADPSPSTACAGANKGTKCTKNGNNSHESPSMTSSTTCASDSTITAADVQAMVHAYNEESSSLLRNEVVHSPTLTNRSGMDNPQAVNVLPVTPNQELEHPWHDTDI